MNKQLKLDKLITKNKYKGVWPQNDILARE